MFEGGSTIMKLPKNFSTSIDELLGVSNRKTIFLSTWDKEMHKNEVPYEIIAKSTNITLDNINKYQYMDEMHHIKEYIANSISLEEKIVISSNSLAIAPNGTASSYLILRTLNQNKKNLSIVINPNIFFLHICIKRFL